MKHFTTIHDIANAEELIQEALAIKESPFSTPTLGSKKTIGLIFMNPSLRTRLSTQKAAQNLGMNVICMNMNNEGWSLEMVDGSVMNGNKAEHIKDAAAVMGLYCDVIGIRCFPGLKDKKEDYSEKLLLQFMRHSKAPVISLESATLHPLQSLADVITIKETWKHSYKPKIVLCWAPHIKPLPQAVPNSLAEWTGELNMNLVIAQPPGYELCEDYTGKAKIIYDQEDALMDADYIYVKNWSAFNDYGKMPDVQKDWLLNEDKMLLTKNARLMHCLPVRRNVEVPDKLLDGSNSLILQQASNRVFAAQAVLKKILEKNFQTNNTIHYEETIHS